jgi:hypothetical protein
MHMQRHTPKPTEVPEDVLAEMDIEERRAAIGSVPPPSVAVPEEVRSELYQEARRAGEEQRLELHEGRPPADNDDSAAQ